MNESNLESATPDEPELPAERKNTIVVRAWRFENRKKLEAAREQKLFERSPMGKLARYWQKNFDKLGPEEQAEIRTQHDRATLLLRDIASTIDDISNNRIAGESMCYPDALYAEVKVFLADNPPIHCWMGRRTAAITPDDLESCDDIPFRDFGLETRLPDFLVEEFKRLTLAWARSHPGDYATVVAELEAIVPDYTPKPAPVQTGSRQATRAEEMSIQQEKKHAEMHRRIMEGRR